MNDLEKLFEHAPEGATELAVNINEHEVLWVKRESGVATGWSLTSWDTKGLDEDFKTIATRPQPTFVDGLVDKAGGKAKALHKPRKTVEDAVEAFPGGWPSDEYSCLFKTAPNWNGTPERMGDYELAGYTGDKKDGVSLWLDGDEGWVLVCTREEFEACVAAKAKSEPEWTHTYISDNGFIVKCKLISQHLDLSWVYDGEQVVIETSSLKPIKPTISKAEAWGKLEFYTQDEWLVRDAIVEIGNEYDITD